MSLEEVQYLIPTMSYTKLLYHIVFRPKNSIQAIPIAHEEILYRYIWGFLKNKGCVLNHIGGMPDHIHLLVQIPPVLSLSDFMRDLKTSTHRYMCGQKDKFPLFDGWGKSYCALSCSVSEKDRIAEYIKNQKAHHQRMNFQDELLKLLKDNGVEVDMKYFLKE